jgi:hypothetical protein
MDITKPNKINPELLEAMSPDKQDVSAVASNDGVMPRAFMDACYKKFIRRAKENNRTLQPWKDEPKNFF